MSTRGKSRASASAVPKQKDRDAEPSVKEEGASVYDDNSPPLSPLSSASSTLSDPPDERDAHDAEGISEAGKGKKKRDENGEGPSVAIVNGKLRNGPSSTEVMPCVSNIINTLITRPQTQCEVCHKTDRGLQMLLCDGCDCGES